MVGAVERGITMANIKRIWKYPILIDDAQIVPMPHNAIILSAKLQGDTLCLWALVSPVDEPVRDRRIWIYGTGHEIYGDPGVYVGTVLVGSLVFHVFDGGEVEA